MFNLVVLFFSVFAFASARPSATHADVAVVPAAPAVAIPSAVSYQTRTDIISKPLVQTVVASAPVITATAAPLIAAAAPVIPITKKVEVSEKLVLPEPAAKITKTEISEVEPKVAVVEKVETPVAPTVVKSIIPASAPFVYAAAPAVAYTSYVAPAVISAYTAPAAVKSAYLAPAAVAYAAPAALAYSAPHIALPTGISTTEIRTNGVVTETKTSGW